jgi:hypothetical protein
MSLMVTALTAVNLPDMRCDCNDGLPIAQSLRFSENSGFAARLFMADVRGVVVVDWRRRVVRSSPDA